MKEMRDEGGERLRIEEGEIGIKRGEGWLGNG